MKHENEDAPVFEPYDFVKYIAKIRGLDAEAFRLPSIGVIVFNSMMLEYFINEFKAKHKPWLYNIRIKPICNPYISNISGKDVVFIIPGWGAPRATAVMEEMIACDTKIFLIMGFCGALREEINIGDIIIPIEALIDEGTSRHYIPEAQVSKPDTYLTNVVKEVCTKLGVKVYLGKIWSTDAVYRETVGKVKRFREMGAICVDMETSALFTLGTFRNVKVAAIHIVSDNLSRKGWQPAFRSKSIKERYALFKKIIWETVEKLNLDKQKL
ncbi:MAG: hypothetical protein DRJ64_02770 [Thermoprotei archaeon]|nr:MAG: hypothetical protein DRJ64_02770 [Thermoprotei archaeon]